MSFPIVPYVAVLVLSGALTGLIAAYVASHRSVIGADWFAALMASSTVWILTVLGMLLARSVAVEELLLIASVFVSNVVPLLWFAFVLAYTGHEHLLTRRPLALIWTTPLIVNVTLLTSATRGLVFPSLARQSVGGLTVVTGSLGPLAVLVFLHNYALFVIGLWLVVATVWEHDRLFAGQAFWFLVGTVLPVVGGLVELFRVGPAGHVPVIPVFFVVTGLAYGYALYRHRLLDLIPATRALGEREIIESLDEGVVIVDHDGAIVRVNESAERAFGCEAAEWLGEPVESFLSDVGARSLADIPTEFRHRGRLYEVTASAIDSARDEPVGRTLVFRDITEHRGRKQRLAVLNRVLRHNIRNSMTGAVGHARILEDRLDTDEQELAQRIAELGEEIVRLSEKARTVEQLLDGGEEPTSVCLADLVDSVVESLDPDGTATVDVSVPGDLTLVTERAILGVVLENILENAVEHAGSDPTVTVTAERRTGGYHLTVTDDGPGIPPAELEGVAAGTETSLQHGTGLGLWVIDWGATRLGGEASFGSTGDGARVSLWVPDRWASDSEAPPQSPTDRETRPDDSGRSSEVA